MKRIAELTSDGIVPSIFKLGIEKICLALATEENGIRDILIASQTFAYDPKLINYALCALGNIYLQLPSIYFKDSSNIR